MLKVSTGPMLVGSISADSWQATMPVVTLLTAWALKTSQPSLHMLGKVSLIVLGIMIASVGEIQFVLIGFLYQAGGILFEAMRLVLVEQLLSGSGMKMDPLVSLYYFAPVCAVMNASIALVLEVPRVTFAEVANLGLGVLLLNGCVTFLLNVSSVLLVSHRSNPLERPAADPRGVDCQDIVRCNDSLRRPEGYSTCGGFYADLWRSSQSLAGFWLLDCDLRITLL